MEEKVLTCLTCRVAFADLSKGREHYRSEWHRYNTKRKVAQMEPLSAEAFKNLTVTKQEKKMEEKVLTCLTCRVAFADLSKGREHYRSKWHRYNTKRKGVQMEPLSAEAFKNQTVTKQEKEWEDDDSWDDDEELIGLEECLFCSHISSSLETNLSHMTARHSFFLPDAEFVSDLEGLVVFLGEMISQGHMCLWCQDHSKLFRSVQAVQKHMVDKGHCKMRHDDASRMSYADFYDYRSSYPDADEAADDDEAIDPEMLISRGFELVLPSGSSIGHRSLARYYKQNHGGRQMLVKRQQTPLSKVLANYKAVGWTGSTGAAVKQYARDMHYLQRLKKRYFMKVGTQANKMQFHFRPQNPI